jgi:hypothetical protein
MNRPNEAAEFERWLDRELPRVVATELDASIPPPRPLATPSRSRGRRGIAAPRLKGAAVLVALALVFATGAALTTGSPNPVSWGHQVVQAVTVGSLVPQRTPAPTPHPTPPARSVTRAAGTDAEAQRTASDTGAAGDSGAARNAGAAGADQDNGNQDGAKPGHDDGSPPSDADGQPKDQGHQQGPNKQP